MNELFAAEADFLGHSLSGLVPTQSGLLLKSTVFQIAGFQMSEWNCWQTRQNQFIGFTLGRASTCHLEMA